MSIKRRMITGTAMPAAPRERRRYKKPLAMLKERSGMRK